MSVEQLTSFFMWMTIINFALLLFSTAMVMLLKNFIYKIHAKMFNLSPEQISVIAYCYLGMFKVLVIVFNLAPLLALLML